MNKLLRLVSVSVLLFFSANLLAATGKDVSYNIVSGWSDSKDIYFLYTKNSALEHYSLTDVHGTILKEKVEFFYQKLDRNLIAKTQFIDLDKGVAAEGLIYLDSDFELSEKNGTISVKNRNQKFALACDRKIWGNANAVRFSDKLFYCGNLVSVEGEVPEKLPVELEEKIARYSGERKTKKGGTPSVITCAKDGRNLNVVAFDDGGRKETPLDFISINIDTYSLRGIETLPFISEHFRTVNHLRAYYANGFVVQKRAYSSGDWWNAQVCTMRTCRELAWPHTFAYLVVDTSGDSGVFIERDNLGTSKAKLTTLTLVGNSTR